MMPVRLIDLILVKSVSRFARNVIDANDYLHELKSHNVEIDSTVGNLS